MSQVIFKKGWEHGEPGGPNGEPIRRYRSTEPVPFLPRHALKNDPEATPLIDPYTGNPAESYWIGWGLDPGRY
jgi:hypothetical protein